MPRPPFAYRNLESQLPTLRMTAQFVIINISPGAYTKPQTRSIMEDGNGPITNQALKNIILSNQEALARKT